MSGTIIFIGTTSCFKLGPLKSGMFFEVKMTRCKLQGWRWRGGNGEVETGEQGEAAKLEGARGRERLLGWRRLEGRARLLGWTMLVQGEAVRLEKAVEQIAR